MSQSDRLTWGHSTVTTACPLDCPDCCSLDVSVEKGRVVAIDGTPGYHTTNGFICAKVRGFADRVYAEDRLLHPLVRKGRKGSRSFERVSWDEALSLIVTRIRTERTKHGSECILPLSYGGSNGLITQDTVDADFFRRLGASRLARTVCAAATGAAAQGLYGKMTGISYEDYVHSRLIVMWGANSPASGMHLVPFIREAQERGAVVAVVDPRETPFARTAALHLPVRPGTDLALALAVHRYCFENGYNDDAFLSAHATGAETLRAKAADWTFERAASVTGVDAALIEEFADLYVRSTPAVIRCGWGPERNRNGGSAIAAILALPAVAGKFGVRGGGYTMSNSMAWGLRASDWSRTPEPNTRLINMNRIGRILVEGATPPVTVLFVYNANPLATLPDQNRVLQGLLREDLFTVVYDQVMTDTAHYADVILPATTFLETYDIAKGYGAYNLQLVKPVIDAVGESRPNVEVFSELLEQMDLLAPAESVESEAEVLMRVVGAMPDSLRDPVLAQKEAVPPAGLSPVQFVDVFPPTPDRRVHLFPAELDAQAPAGLYSFQPDPASDDYPLALISPSSEKTVNSTLGELRRDIVRLYMHTDDARARGLTSDDAVRVFNAQGEMHCFVTIGDHIARGTVSVPKGLWRRSSLNESTSNALVPDTLTDLGGGACFNDARVEVTRIITAGYEGQSVGVFVATGGHSRNVN
ncbi:MAG: molybdopterin-dependent oxidoreductase [Vicinamibacterales bacterium]